MRLIIVVPANRQTVANQTIAKFTSRGDQTFTTPLYARNGTTIRAYWCSWDVEATGKTRTALATLLRSDLNLNASDVTPITATTLRTLNPTGTEPILVFNGDQITPAEILAKLSLAPLPADHPDLAK